MDFFLLKDKVKVLGDYLIKFKSV